MHLPECVPVSLLVVLEGIWIRSETVNIAGIKWLFVCRVGRDSLRLKSTEGSLSNDDGDVNENSKKAIGLDSGNTTTLHVHHAFLYFSLPSLYVYDVKLPNFMFCRGREHKTKTLFFFP